MSMNKLMTTAAICIAVAELSAYAGDMKLWYRSEARDWVEALPVGNGRLGAVSFQASVKSPQNPVYTGPVTAQEVRARKGVGHFMEKVKAGKEVRVAYLGGSITAMDGWRNLTTDIVADYGIWYNESR